MIPPEPYLAALSTFHLTPLEVYLATWSHLQDVEKFCGVTSRDATVTFTAACAAFSTLPGSVRDQLALQQLAPTQHGQTGRYRWGWKIEDSEYCERSRN
jgi:hypothetical protein